MESNNYRYEISFLADIKDRDLIADEISRVFENFMHKKHLIKSDIKIEAMQSKSYCVFMRNLSCKIKAK